MQDLTAGLLFKTFSTPSPTTRQNKENPIQQDVPYTVPSVSNRRGVEISGSREGGDPKTSCPTAPRRPGAVPRTTRTPSSHDTTKLSVRGRKAVHACRADIIIIIINKLRKRIAGPLGSWPDRDVKMRFCFWPQTILVSLVWLLV